MLSEKEYGKMVEKASPDSPLIKDMIWAYVVGGLICVLGQLFKELYLSLGISEENVKVFVPSTLVFLAAVFTALGLFGKLAKHAGAGTLVPITGFSNAVVSPAIEFKKEGLVTGIGVNIFKIAGPVIAYGTLASVVYGLLLCLF